MTQEPTTYLDSLRAEFAELIDALAVTPTQKRFLHSRWLEQIVWLEGKAASAQHNYYVLRLTTIVGAVLVPALVSLTTVSGGVGTAARVAAWVVSLIVAVSAAVEQFFHYGDRWRNYRRTVEGLKIEGWLYFQASGRYGAGAEATYAAFAERVEEILRADVDVYLTQIVADKGHEQGQAPAP